MVWRTAGRNAKGESDPGLKPSQSGVDLPRAKACCYSNDPAFSCPQRGPARSSLRAAIKLGALLAVLCPVAAHAQVTQPSINPLSAAWTAVGPVQVASQSYGLVTGRVTSVAIDPADGSGNTVYVGTTGGGLWKSVNAAGPAGSVVFRPLTDTLPVFSANAGAAAEPALTIGAVSVGNGVILAGTGDGNNALDSYYGEGILRSADGGATWSLIQESHDGVAGNHTFVGLATAGFAWSTATPGLVVAAMSQSAEGVVVNAGDATYSVMGLYYSTDAGVSWQMATIEDGSQFVQRPLPGGAPGNAVTAVVWNAVRRRFYAAVRLHGYYESTDGVTWTRLTAQPGTGLTMTACPTNPGSVGSAGCPIFRGALAVQVGTGDTFAISLDVNNLDQGVWQDVCGLTAGSCAAAEIAFGKRLGSAALEVGSGSAAIAQGSYNLELAAVANGSDTVLYAGTVDLYKCSLTGGCVWRNTTNAVNGCAMRAGVAPSQHAVAALASAGTGGLPLVFVGNDGGLWRSLDGVNELRTACSADDATHFDNLNAALGSLAEVVSVAESPTDAGTLLVGLGVNGTAGTGAAVSVAAWTQLAAGEGGTVAIDPANPLNWYASVGPGVDVRDCGKGSGCGAADFVGGATIGAAQVGGDSSVLDAPFVLDPALSTDVLVGTCRVWRGVAGSGAGWPGANAISTEMGGTLTGVCGGTSALVRSLGAGGPASGAGSAQDAGSTVLYAGMAGTLDGGGTAAGHVFANYAAGTAGAGTAWTDVAKSQVTNDVADAGKFNPGGFDVSAVVADAHDATGKTVYATVMGFAGNGMNASHVYRSVNGGGSWVNVSSNLPNVPANGLVIDPNDANTVYVAMDAGVYVTTAVSTCTTANCWSVYGAGLPNAPVTGLVAATGIATGDGRQGELRAATYGRGVWGIPLLTATTAAVPAMTLSVPGLTFAAQAVGTESAAQTISVTNSGNAALTVSQIVNSGDFTETDNCVGMVAVGASCAVQVEFLPSATGARTGLVTIYGNVAGGQDTAALSGTGTAAAAIVLNPVSVTYSGTNVGASSGPRDITISNTGGAVVTLGTVAVIGDFTLSANTCGPSLSPGVGCTVAVEFVPTASGARTGTLTVTDSVGTQTASLSGTGVLPATDSLAPLSLSFAAQVLQTASGTQQVTLTNAGDAALVGIAGQITSGDFTVVNGCGNSLNGHSSCEMSVSFVPTGVGARTGVLTVTDTYRAQTVALNGVGIAPAGVSLSPVSTVAFGATGVGLSAVQTATLTNNGGVVLAIQSIGATGDFAVSANTCGTTLAPGAACSMQVVFSPTAAGARAGSFAVIDSAGSSPQTLQLTGTGVDFSLAANGSTAVTIAAGGQAVYPLLLRSAAGVPGTVAFACTGAPANSTCVVTPSTAGLGGTTTTVSVTVLTDVAWMQRPEIGPGRPMVWMVFMLPLGLVRLARKHVRVIAAMLCLIAVVGCGAPREIPATSVDLGGGGSGVVTPSGTYNLTVSGTSAGLTRSVGLVLVVQ
jgi:hypothetical protein